MVSGKSLNKTLTKQEFIKLYKKNGSIEGVHRETGFDTGALRKFMKEHDIPLKYKTKYNHNDNAFKEHNELSYYWAGFIAADGCIKEKNKATKILAVALANKDYTHLQKLKNFLQAEEPIKKYDNHSDLHIVSKTIAKDLKIFNIAPRKTHIYTFPEWMLEHKMVNHFMRGYFDGDGCLHINKNKQMQISLRGTKEFLLDFKNILTKNCNTNNIKIGFNNGIHSLTYCGNTNAKKIISYLYNNSSVFLDRKYEMAKLYLNR